MEQESAAFEVTSTEATLRSQISTPKTDLAASRCDLTAAQSFARSANSIVAMLKEEIDHFYIQVSDSTTTAEGLPLQIFRTQLTISAITINTLRMERHHQLGLLQLLVVYFAAWRVILLR